MNEGPTNRDLMDAVLRFEAALGAGFERARVKLIELRQT
jgi:hypothetical protein